MRAASLHVLVCCALLCCALPADADTIRFVPDSLLVGELKRLERGRIYFKTDATGTIPVEMDNVVSVVSAERVQIELTSGSRYLGYLRYSDQPGVARFQTQQRELSIPLGEIVSMTPIESRLRERFDGEIDAGLNFTKDSEVLQTNFGLDLQYVADNNEVNLAANSIVTRDSANESFHRSELRLNTLRRLRGNWANWSAGLRVGVARNDGLGTDLRASIGAGVRRDLRQTNLQRLNISAGLLFTKERSAGERTNDESLEGFFAINYELFRYDAPEVDLSTNFEIIPNFSERGRYRTDLDVTLKWELYEDLFWRLSFYDSFDSDPPSAEGDRNDYGVITGFAWEF